MAKAAGFVLAAGGIVAANEAIFAPIAQGGTGRAIPDIATSFNWRLVPATVILALLLTGLETVAPEFAAGLGGLTILAVLVIPVGNAPTPMENIAKVVNP